MANDEVSNFDWLCSIAKIKDEPWHNDLVIRISDIENIRFYRQKSKNYQAHIDPNQIKGIQYLDNYNHNHDITWKGLLNNLKRFDKIRRNKKTYDKVLDHALYCNTEPRSLHKYGDIYITTGGQHRMALCKFLKVPSVEVSVQEYLFDHDLYNSYLARKSFLDRLINENLINAKSYERALNDDSNHTSILIRGKYIWIKPHCFNSFINFYRDLKTNRFTVSISLLNQRLFGEPSTHNNDIESEKDMARFKDFLRLIKSGHIS